MPHGVTAAGADGDDALALSARLGHGLQEVACPECGGPQERPGVYAVENGGPHGATLLVGGEKTRPDAADTNGGHGTVVGLLQKLGADLPEVTPPRLLRVVLGPPVTG